MADVVQKLPGAPVEVDLGRGSRAALFKAIPLAALLSGACIYAALDAKDTPTAVVGWCFAAFFALPLVLALLNVKKLLEPRGLIFDARGINYWQGDARLLLAWETVSAIGVGFDKPPSVRRLSKRIADTIVDPRRNFAVEIFPVDPSAVEQQLLLRRYRREGNTPAQGLPRLRWRLPLPPHGSLDRRVEEGVQAFRRQSWLGWFART